MIARALLLGLSCLLLARPAWAQANTARTIGFENGCDGQPVPELAAGSALLASEFYESCGVSAITTGGASAQMQLVAPTTAIAGVTGSAALAGALEVSGAISTEPLAVARSAQPS